MSYLTRRYTNHASMAQWKIRSSTPHSPPLTTDLYRIARFPFFFLRHVLLYSTKLTPPFISPSNPCSSPALFSCSANLHSETCPYFRCHGLELLLRTMCTKSTHPGTLKWKSQDITNANTMQARRKLRNRCPCQNLRVSVDAAWAAAVLLDSFHCSMKSASQKPATLHAVEPQISQILRQWKKGWRHLKQILVCIQIICCDANLLKWHQGNIFYNAQLLKHYTTSKTKL